MCRLRSPAHRKQNAHWCRPAVCCRGSRRRGTPAPCADLPVALRYRCSYADEMGRDGRAAGRGEKMAADRRCPTPAGGRWWPAVTTGRESGKPATLIAATTAAEEAHLLVLRGHDATAIRRLLRDSATSAVRLPAHDVVLTARPSVQGQHAYPVSLKRFQRECNRHERPGPDGLWARTGAIPPAAPWWSRRR